MQPKYDHEQKRDKVQWIKCSAIVSCITIPISYVSKGNKSTLEMMSMYLDNAMLKLERTSISKHCDISEILAR
jgi:hypothetical protein